MRTVIINRKEERVIPAQLEAMLPFRLTDALRRALPEGGIIEEIRLRRGRCASLTVGGRNIILDTILSGEEIDALLVGLCGGSLYAHGETIRRGYITIPGGIRAGICGSAAIEGGRIIGVSEVSSIVLRIPHKAPEVGAELARLIRLMKLSRGLLIYSPPGIGKTTVLRGAAASLASGGAPLRVAVVDTRGELAAGLEARMLTIDILSGYPRGEGIEIAARTLGAEVIICDEIGDVGEAEAIVSVHNCGVPLLASAHAGDICELMKKPGIAKLHKSRCFGAYAGLSRVSGRAFVYSYDITEWEAANDYI